MTWEVLERLGDEQRRLVLAATVRRRYRKGQVIFHKGDPGGTLWFAGLGTTLLREPRPVRIMHRR